VTFTPGELPRIHRRGDIRKRISGGGYAFGHDPQLNNMPPKKRVLVKGYVKMYTLELRGILVFFFFFFFFFNFFFFFFLNFFFNKLISKFKIWRVIIPCRFPNYFIFQNSLWQ